jgi:hypothetical protein
MSDKFNIVQFQTASGIPLTANFIVDTLGVAPDETVKRAMYWNRDKYGLIIGRLQNFINGKAAVNPCAESGERASKKPAAAADESFDFGETPADSAESFEFGEDETEGFF